MERISVNDRVQIVLTKPGEQQLLHKFGTVMMIVDGVNCFVILEDGNSATVNITQLKKA